jgi:hypothetical protein
LLGHGGVKRAGIEEQESKPRHYRRQAEDDRAEASQAR